MVKISVFPRGTRVRVRRAGYPIDPAMVGREGLVLRHNRIVPDQVAVQLDGETHLRTFTDEELEAVTREVSVRDAGSSGPGISTTGE